LRRAAAKLREQAQAARDADVFVEDVPWTVEEDDDDEATLYLVADRPSVPTTTYIAEGFLSRAHADFAALMHPPVALALADWLDAASEEAKTAEALGIGHLPSVFPAFAVARAILREES
jgi:hypothetical protein